MILPPRPPMTTWDEVLAGRTSYDGSLSSPKELTGVQIKPRRPPRELAGSARAEEVTTGETRRVALDPSQLVRGSSWSQAPRTGKIWARLEKVCREVVELLLERGLTKPSHLATDILFYFLFLGRRLYWDDDDLVFGTTTPCCPS